MLRQLCILILITCASQSHAMKRLQNQPTLDSFDNYFLLPSELHNVIIDSIKNITRKPKEATRTINAFSRTNKHFNTLINKQQFTNTLINDFAHKFYCSHETIANFLHTKQAKAQRTLQNKLRALCTSSSSLYFNLSIQTKTDKLNKLIEGGVNLEFT